MNHLGEIRKDYFSDEFVIIKTKETKKIKRKINKESQIGIVKCCWKEFSKMKRNFKN